MEPEVQHLVQRIHDSPHKLVVVTAGAGTQAVSDLLGVAGASRTLMEALVPYSAAAFDDFLGQTPEKYVTSNAAKLLAGRALTRARWLEQNDKPVIGLACTATIITDRPKKGEHRAHLAIWQNERLSCHSLYLDKGARNRAEEEAVVSQLMLNMLMDGCGIDRRLPLSLTDGDRLESHISDYTKEARKLLDGRQDFFGISDTGEILSKPPAAILAGSFNPLHDGHLDMARAAAGILGHPVAFELSVVNADKPPLAQETILARMAQFAGRWPVYAGTAPTFIEKSRLYPKAAFVVGYDTAVRILHRRYYNDSAAERDAALTELKERGSRFLVAGRVDADEIFRDIDHLDIPAGYSELFQPIPMKQFRKDISSTELRRRGLRGSR